MPIKTCCHYQITYIHEDLKQHFKQTNSDKEESKTAHGKVIPASHEEGTTIKKARDGLLKKTLITHVECVQ